MISCPNCGKQYPKRGIGTHVWRAHGLGQNHDSRPPFGKVPWNKGQKKEDNEKLRVAGEKISNKTRGKSKTGLSLKHRESISRGMLAAHSEGRAWNIGQSRWNNEPSYPEKWFMLMLEQEELDTSYVRELSFGRFSLDFAWIERKICVEIDGEQHQRDVKQTERDRNKDALLAEKGWRVLRLPWRAVFNDPRAHIELVREFFLLTGPGDRAELLTP